MTSIQQFAFQSAVRDAKAALGGHCSPFEAKELLARCGNAYAADVARFGEANVKAAPAYAELVSVQGDLEKAAAGAVRRAVRLEAM